MRERERAPGKGEGHAGVGNAIALALCGGGSNILRSEAGEGEEERNIVPGQVVSKGTTFS